jgi:AraC-like DNA-binding protein
MPAGYFAPATGLIWQIVAAYGRDPRALFEACGLDSADIADPDLRLPCERVERLWHAAARVIGDPCFGLRAAEHLHPSHLGALGYAWLASPTLRAALGRVRRYLALLTDRREIRLHETDAAVAVETRLEPGARNLPQRADIAMTVLMTMCRWNAGRELAPLVVRFRHPPPDCADGFATFFRSEVAFDAARDEIVLATADVDRPLPSGNPHLAGINDAYLVAYLGRLERGDVVGRVKRVIGERLSDGDLRLADVADRLNISARTLQRRLAAADTSFADLVDKTRRELAEACLRDPHTTLTEVAFRAGFSTQSSFNNAVRRWTGLTPGLYRQQLV